MELERHENTTIWQREQRRPEKKYRYMITDRQQKGRRVKIIPHQFPMARIDEEAELEGRKRRKHDRSTQGTTTLTEKIYITN